MATIEARAPCPWKARSARSKPASAPISCSSTCASRICGRRSDPVQRLARFANGADVDTTIVGRRVLMRGRKLTGHDEGAILDRAEKAFRAAMQRAGLA